MKLVYAVGPYQYDGFLGVADPAASPVPDIVHTDHIEIVGTYVAQPLITFTPGGGNKFSIVQTGFMPEIESLLGASESQIQIGCNPAAAPPTVPPGKSCKLPARRRCTNCTQ
jgi:hypothetical protein